MQSLAFSVRTLQGNLDISLIVSQPRLQPANMSSKSQICTNYQGENAHKTRSKGATKCI